MPISTVWTLNYVQQCYVKWFWTISSLGAPVIKCSAFGVRRSAKYPCRLKTPNNLFLLIAKNLNSQGVFCLHIVSQLLRRAPKFPPGRSKEMHWGYYPVYSWYFKSKHILFPFCCNVWASNPVQTRLFFVSCDRERHRSPSPPSRPPSLSITSKPFILRLPKLHTIMYSSFPTSWHINLLTDFILLNLLAESKFPSK